MPPRKPQPGPSVLDILWERLMAAVAMVMFSAPACVLLFFMFNRILAGGTPLGWSLLGWSIAGCALLGFLFPKGAFDVMGALWEVVLGSNRW